VTDVLSWESTSDPDRFELWIYKNGTKEQTVEISDGSTRSYDLNSALQTLGKMPPTPLE